MYIYIYITDYDSFLVDLFHYVSFYLKFQWRTNKTETSVLYFDMCKKCGRHLVFKTDIFILLLSQMYQGGGCRSPGLVFPLCLACFLTLLIFEWTNKFLPLNQNSSSSTWIWSFARSMLFLFRWNTRKSLPPLTEPLSPDPLNPLISFYMSKTTSVASLSAWHA